jgi:hypothetical protein
MSEDTPQYDLQAADRNVAKAIDKAGEPGSNEVRLSTGVVLLAKQANPNMLIRAMTSHRRPDPPQVFVKEMGRTMENLDDPDYISRVQAWQMEYSNTMLNVLIGLGTELKSKPKNVSHYEDDAWLKDYQTFGFDIFPESKAWRYITWVMFVAAPTEADTKLIGDKVKAMSGIREADVADAETFPTGN